MVLPDRHPRGAQLHVVDVVPDEEGSDGEADGEEDDHEEGGDAGPAEGGFAFIGRRTWETHCIWRWWVDCGFWSGAAATPVEQTQEEEK